MERCTHRLVLTFLETWRTFLSFKKSTKNDELFLPDTGNAVSFNLFMLTRRETHACLDILERIEGKQVVVPFIAHNGMFFFIFYTN